MKILHITPAYVPSYKHGGPIKGVHYLNKYLARLGVDVTVYTTTINGNENLSVPLETPVMIDGVRVIYFKPSFPRAWSYSRSMHKALSKTAGQFDLIHITSVFLAASMLGAHYARKFKKPYIISPRGSLMSEPLTSFTRRNRAKKSIYLSLIEKRNLRAASIIHFTSDAEQEEYIAAGLPLARGVIIPNSFDVEDFDKEANSQARGDTFNVPPGAKIVLFLSRLDWKKGFDTLIPAFGEVLKALPNTILVIAGGDEGGYKKTVISLIERYKIKEHVRFTGMVLGADKINLLKRSAVFVLPSYSENFGMAVVEAMYSGVPVVITKGVGIAPDIERAGAGIVVEKNPNAVSSAIIKVLAGAVSGDMGERGKMLVETKFDAMNVAKQMSFVYDGLVHII
ncbi:MAG: glycosyltransferase [Candidatus Jorgensenbacteria bacterium]|nr:glycosyltransferase [Candidatus Jorgensenbacteria bacterium]